MVLGGRYEQLLRIASGGMATVYVGRLRGAGGFSRLVAIKRAHPHVVEDPQFRHVVSEEARLASQLHHPNFVPIVDVEESDGELALIMDYVEGGTLSELLGAAGQHQRHLPADVVVRIVIDACAGLEAVHSLSDAVGRPLRLVHRDVSPQNILVGVDGVARLSDLGVAKSLEVSQGTQSGVLKGKLGYMAPEYVEGHAIDARADLFAMAVVVWEALTSTRLFRASNEAETLRRMISYEPPPLESLRADLPPELDGLLRAGLSKHPGGRPPSTRAFAAELERIARPRGLVASHEAVAGVVKHLLGEKLDARRNVLREKMGLPALPVGEITQDDGDAPTFVQGLDTFAGGSTDGATTPRHFDARQSSLPDDGGALPEGAGPAGAATTPPRPPSLATVEAEVTTLGRSGLVREPSAPAIPSVRAPRTALLAVGAGLAALASAAALVFALTRAEEHAPQLSPGSPSQDLEPAPGSLAEPTLPAHASPAPPSTPAAIAEPVPSSPASAAEATAPTPPSSASAAGSEPSASARPNASARPRPGSGAAPPKPGRPSHFPPPPE